MVAKGEVTEAATGADQEVVEVAVLVEGEVDHKEGAGAGVVVVEAGRRSETCRVIREAKYQPAPVIPTHSDSDALGLALECPLSSHA